MIKKHRGGRRIPRSKTDVSVGSNDGLKPQGAKTVNLGFLNTDKPQRQKELMNEEQEEAGIRFLNAAEKGDRDFFAEYIEHGGNVNFQDPMTGKTALHIAAGTSDKFQIRALVNSGRCNFLIEDNQGELASDIAFTNSPLPEISRYLGLLEQDQKEVTNSFGDFEPRR